MNSSAFILRANEFDLCVCMRGIKFLKFNHFQKKVSVTFMRNIANSPNGNNFIFQAKNMASNLFYLMRMLNYLDGIFLDKFTFILWIQHKWKVVSSVTLSNSIAMIRSINELFTFANYLILLISLNVTFEILNNDWTECSLLPHCIKFEPYSIDLCPVKHKVTQFHQYFTHMQKATWN